MTAVEPPWAPVDPLGEALHALRMAGVFYCRSELDGAWGLEMPAFPSCLSFHVVTTGACWLQVPGAEDRYLRPGDIALVPHGRGHLIRSTPAAPVAGRVDLLPQTMVGDHYSVLRLGGGAGPFGEASPSAHDAAGGPTNLVCGIVQLTHPSAQRLLDLLPLVIHVDASHPDRTGWIMPTLGLMSDEAIALRPGGEAVITRLADILVIQAIRSWLEHDADARQGWLLALRDEQIGAALALVHRNPELPWTVARLAQHAAMSRSAFAARFTDLVGMPVMAYVTRWRMDLAVTALEEGATVGPLARRLGYESEAGFSRAFRRAVGRSPGAVGRTARTARPTRPGGAEGRGS
jgi:AraC-like DNA-binding protein